MTDTDILIAGGGIAGLSAAARFAAAGARVAVVDPAPASAPQDDLRTTAYLQLAAATLTRAGVWDDMAEKGAPLRLMRLVDAGGLERTPRETADFTAAPAGHDVFGWNIPNAAAKTALLARVDSDPAISLHQGRSAVGLVTRMDRALVRLDDGTQISAKLVIGADGRGSTVRRLSGIDVRRWEYGQQALVFAVTHPRPHDGISTEIHRTGGPLTLVPMPDRDGHPCSSVVWMVPGPRAAELSALDDTALVSVLTDEAMALYGPLEITGPRAVWPIVSQIATRLTGQRTALVAEAAHVMPPIGAQGLNTSLHDIEVLASLIEGAPDPGTDDILTRYARRVWPHMASRIAGVDLLNRAAQTEVQPLRDLRRLGLSALNRIRPLRNLAVRTGMGL